MRDQDKARARLRAVWKKSNMSLRELALVIGVTRTTIERHVSGSTIARSRVEWYLRLRRIYADDEGVHVVTRPPGRVKKKWGWNLSRAERDNLRPRQ